MNRRFTLSNRIKEFLKDIYSFRHEYVTQLKSEREKIGGITGQTGSKLRTNHQRQGILKREEKAGMEFIRGESRGQRILIPDCIDDYITDNNAVRVIEAYANSLDMAALGCGRPEPNATGRPIYDTKDLLKLYLYGYMNRIRSSRQMERESGRNLEVLWLLRTLKPDHKTTAAYEVTGDGNDKNHLTPMAVAAAENMEAEGLGAVADRGYRSVQDIVAGMAAGLDIHVAGTDYDICVSAEEEGDVITGHKDGRYVYYEERNIVLCPAGHALPPAFYKKGKEKEYMPAGKPAGDARTGARRKSAGDGTRYRWPNQSSARHIMRKGCW
jgi:transposase